MYVLGFLDDFDVVYEVLVVGLGLGGDWIEEVV